MAVLSRGQITISNLIDGKISHTHQAWADGIVNGIGSVGFSLTDSIGKKYTGFYSDFNEQPSTDPTKYSWVETSNAIEQEIAYAWSPDGTDRFTRVWNENLFRNTSKPIIHSAKGSQIGYSPAGGELFKAFQGLPPVKEGSTYTLSFDYSIANFNNSRITKLGYGLGMAGTPGQYQADTYTTLNLYTSPSGKISVKFVAKKPNGYNYLAFRPFRWEPNDVKFDLNEITAPEITITNMMLQETDTGNTFFISNPQDDYDNAVPHYIGRSLKDSNSPTDYTWEPNPERRPWTSYAQGLNGEGLSLMPYGENRLLKSDMRTSFTIRGITATLDTSTSTWTVSGTTTETGDLYGFRPGGKDYDGIGNYTYSLELVSGTFPVGICLQAAVYSGGSWSKNYTSVSGVPTLNFKAETNGVRDLGMYSLVAGTVVNFKAKIKLELANTMGIPTPWTPAPTEDPLGAIPKYVGTAALPYEDFSKYAWDLNPAWLQQESNNNLANKVDNSTYNNDQSTVWQEISNRVTEEEAQAIQDSLTNVTNAYTDFVSTGGKHDQDLANLKSAINTDIQKLADKVLGYDFVNTWFRIGDGGLSIGEVNSNFEILISNDQITFYDSGTAVAYVSNQSFFINSGMIVDDLQIGKFKFAKVNDNLMGLFHIA